VILKAMIITSKHMGPNFLTDYFGDVYKFPLFALERPDAMETVIFSQAHSIICMLIEKAPDSLQGRVHEILEETLQGLSEMCEVEFHELMTQFLQEKFRIIMYCFYRFDPQFQADGVQTANILFKLMRNKDRAIWEEALMSLPDNFPDSPPLSQIPITPNATIIPSAVLRKDGLILVTEFFRWVPRSTSLAAFVDAIVQKFSSVAPFTVSASPIDPVPGGPRDGLPDVPHDGRIPRGRRKSGDHARRQRLSRCRPGRGLPAHRLGAPRPPLCRC
jgi:hypothetical protein